MCVLTSVAVISVLTYIALVLISTLNILVTSGLFYKSFTILNYDHKVSSNCGVSFMIVIDNTS